MALLPIRLYPDPVLRATAAPVESFNDALQVLVDDMVETMYAAPGIGLAAPQVGIDRRLAVVDLSLGKEEGELRVFVNPEISEPDGTWVEEEGCLSIPNYLDKVERPQRIRVRAQDATGAAFELRAEGWLARAICHEVDHLNGILFVDYLRGLRRERARRFLKRMAREAGSAE